MSSNFDFLSEQFPVLADYGQKAEKYLYSDSNSCLMKLGMIGETVVNLMFKYDHIRYPYDNTAVIRIDTLYREDGCLKKVDQALTQIDEVKKSILNMAFRGELHL